MAYYVIFSVLSYPRNNVIRAPMMMPSMSIPTIVPVPAIVDVIIIKRQGDGMKGFLGGF
jgi:hypothetical protein